MTTKRKSKKYTGVLATPIKELPEPRNTLMMLAEGEHRALRKFREEQMSHISREKGKRLRALMEHYGIERGTREPADFLLDLVINMGQDFIPGFRIVNEHQRSGRKTIWGPVQQLNLLDRVAQERRRKKGSTALWACRRLIESDRPYAGYMFDTLYKYYQAAKKKYPDWEELHASPYWDEIQRLALNPKKKSTR
jgi:hypothetical protein